MASPSWPHHWFFLCCWIVDQWWRLLLGMSGGPSQSEWHARSASLGLRSSNDTRGSPASTQLHPRVMVRPGKLPRRFVLHRYRPLKISPSLLLSITFVPGHLHLHRLLEVRGLCSPTLLWFVSLRSSVAPNRGFFILLFFDRHFLWDRLLSTYIFIIRFLIAQYLTALDCSVPSICIHRCSGVYFCLFFAIFFYICLLLLDPALSNVTCTYFSGMMVTIRLPCLYTIFRCVCLVVLILSAPMSLLLWYN
jgi:hypothetical protein